MHADRATLYANIGTTYLKIGSVNQALILFKKSIKIREAIFPANHFSFGRLYNEIGASYIALGNYSEALENLQKCKNI